MGPCQIQSGHWLLRGRLGVLDSRNGLEFVSGNLRLALDTAADLSLKPPPPVQFPPNSPACLKARGVQEATSISFREAVVIPSAIHFGAVAVTSNLLLGMLPDSPETVKGAVPRVL